MITQERREALEDIDPSWCPAWPVDWQRAFHLARLHREAVGALPVGPGTAVVQGEDLGRWVRAQQAGWGKLSAAQQWMLEHVLGVEPAVVGRPRRSRAQIWADNLAAARQYREREGHLNVPRAHVETVVGDEGREREFRLGAFISNQRSRAAVLTSERAAELGELGMRWT